MFQNLYKQFEKKETDLHTLAEQEGFSRFILIRSLDNSHLKELILESTGKKINKGSVAVLYEELFESNISNERIIKYINNKYPEIRQEREEQEKYLSTIISDFDDVKCGVRNDNLNDTAKDLVRDKSIESKKDLDIRVESLLQGTIKGYLYWQYYNQVTNDLIEHIFNNNVNVIPTLRKIKYVDFLVNVNGKIIPFDLKITHISDDYFDLATAGIELNNDSSDSYLITNSSKKEIEEIKDFYKTKKSELSLPNYGGLKKIELINILEENKDEETSQFLSKIKNQRQRIVKDLQNQLASIEWWNYKYQGERLFKNNNRFFVFLAYENSFDDARPLKGNIQAIQEKVEEKLQKISDGEFNTIRYHYSKDKGLEGDYTIISTSVIVTE